MLEVAEFDALEEGVVETVLAAGREVVLVRWKGAVYCLRNICPHQSASFSAGWARPSVVRCLPAPAVDGEPPSASWAWDLAVDDTQPVVRCPWHKWEFRLTDGACVTDPRFRVRAYETTVADGKVFLDAGG